MQVANNNAVPGTDGDHGGEVACNTCYVIVDRQWSEMWACPEPGRKEMLAMNPERQTTSRLSCQVPASEAWDGLILHPPEFRMS